LPDKIVIGPIKGFKSVPRYEDEDNEGYDNDEEQVYHDAQKKLKAKVKSKKAAMQDQQEAA